MTEYEIELVDTDGSWSGTRREDGLETRFTASPSLWLIHQAWGKVDFEDLADGYGAGEGTRGDWSGVRDSSDAAVAAMLGRALTHLFGN